ncbi:MAG: CRISPR-associated endonuclease Cas1 [Thermoprotei archaeon]
MAKTVVVSGYGVRIRFRKGVFRVEKRDGVEEYNPVEIEQVIVATSGVSLTSKTIRKMIEYGIDLVFLDSRGYPIGRIYPPYINRTVDTRRAQYSSYGGDRAIHFIKEVVYAKISNQAGLVKRYYYYTRSDYLREDYEKLIGIREEVVGVSGDYSEVIEKLRSLEARAARIYWGSYALLLPRELGFEGRDQDSMDPVNVSLNYGYGILYSECWKALVLAGLDPYAGYMHVDRSGKPVLVFDFIEQFRFIVDYALLGMFRHKWRPEIVNGLLEYGSRTRIIEAINNFLDKQTSEINGSVVTLRQAIKRKAFELASHLRGETLYTGFVWNW